MNLDRLREKLERAFLDLASDDDGSHDIHHARRVHRLAFEISKREGRGNRNYLMAAAYLHDIVNLPKNAPNRRDASKLSAAASVPVLEECGFSEGDIEAIRHIIVAHSFSAGVSPESDEARMFQDADRIDAMGAVGLARTFYIAGKLGSRLFDGSDPFAEHRPLDDRSFALDHFAAKILRLPETMQTRSGRQLATERTEIIRHYLDALGQELGYVAHW